VRQPARTESGEHNAFHSHGHGNEGIRSWSSAEARRLRRDAEVQRRGREGAGVLLAAEGLGPTSKGARVRFSGDNRTVIDGPFTETKELVAGFSIIKVKSLEEAIEWVKRAPNVSPNGEAEVEIRKLMDVEDFVNGSRRTPKSRK
jgi:hypothetical protein